MKRLPALSALLLAVVLAAGCASRIPPPDQVYAPSDAPERVSAPAAGAAKMIFLRPASDRMKDVGTKVYLVDQPLGTLMPGAYIVHEACAGEVNLAATHDAASETTPIKAPDGTRFRARAGQTYYFVVRSQAEDSPAQITQIDPARLDLGRYKAQTSDSAVAPGRCDAMKPAAAMTSAAPPTPIASATPVPPPAAAAAVPTLCDAAARGAEVKAAPTSLNADDVIALRCAIESWRSAWQGGDFTAYSALYDRGVESEASAKDWDAQRRQRLQNRNISVELGPITLEQRKGLVAASFVQKYRSGQYRDQGSKQLIWKRSEGAWKIVSEGFERSGS